MEKCKCEVRNARGARSGFSAMVRVEGRSDGKTNVDVCIISGDETNL